FNESSSPAIDTLSLHDALPISLSATLFAQSMPSDYESVLKTLGKKGDFKSNVLKINIPRNDVKATIDGIATPTPFGFGGWLAMTDRKSTRLNSSHVAISYAVFC